MVLALFFVLSLTGVVGTVLYAHSARAATNSTINFQARVLQATGAVIPDGAISVQFKIYNVNTGGVAEWTETQALAAKAGYITASLGSVTSFPGTIDWSQEHWITMNVNGDGEMGPTRMKITAVPYSFRSGQADTLTNGSGTISASQLAQLAPGSIQGVSSANSAIRINQTGAGNLLQLQGNGADVLTVSKAGDVTAAAGVTVGNSSSTTAGTIRWTGTAFEGYNGSIWTSLGGGLVMSSGASTSFVSGLANVGANVTGAAVETLVFTSATAVSNTAGITGFTAPTAGSFRTCLVKNNANVTAGTLNVRWRVNGASVGAGACSMSAAVPRQSTTSLDSGVVTFNAGDTIGIAFDTVGLLPAATNDFTVYWSVEYNSSSSSLTMQKVYDSSPAPVTVITADNKDVKYTLSNTATDSNFLVDIATGSTSKFAIQNNGTDILNVNTSGGVGITGNLAVSGTTTLSGNLLAAGSATGTSATTEPTPRTNVGTITLTSGAFADNDVLFINNAGQDYYTRIVSGGGTANLVVSPNVSYDASATVTKYIVQNIGASSTDYTTQANRFFQGYFLGGVVIGAGSTTISDGNISSTTTLTLQKNGNALDIGGALNVSGTITGNGSGITNIDGSQITSGSIGDSSLSANVTLAGNTFNGVSGLVQLDGSGNLPALNGSALTTLNGTNISSGTVADARLSGNVTLMGSAFNGASQLVQLNVSSELPALSGVNLTALNASNISTGTLNDLRLSTNVTKAGNTFNGVSGLVQLDGSGNLPALNGSALTTLNGTNISSGTVADARLTTNVTLLGNTFNGVNQLVKLDGSGFLPALNAGALTTLNGTNISSGTVADARLSANIGLLSTSQSYTGQKTFEANIILGTDTASPTAGLLTLNDATGSNGFTSVLGTNALTASRAVNLPDESGTVCLSNSNNCGYTRFAQASAQVDATTNSSLSINKTGASGNMLTLQKNGVTVFSVLNSGALAVRTTATSALNIKDAGGTDFFNVDTSGGLVQIGSATADANATLLVLDTKNTTGDPTGSNGGTYYNSALGKFRCFQNNAWKDCISETSVRSFVSSTSVAVVDANTTNYWRTAVENNNSYPNLALSQTTKSIMGVVTLETTATSNANVEVSARIERGIGSVPTCGTGTVVGAQPGTFSSNTGGQKASTVQFIDNPNTTSTVYYIICSDTATVNTGANVTRLRLTLQEVNNSN